MHLIIPVFSWRTTLSSNLFNTSPRVSLPSLAAELAFTLLTYGFALSNLAQSIVVSLGQYEFERAISDADRKAKDEQLGFAVTYLCRSAGIFEHIAKEVIPAWDDARRRAAASGLSCPNPPDLSREVLIGLNKYVHFLRNALFIHTSIVDSPSPTLKRWPSASCSHVQLTIVHSRQVLHYQSPTHPPHSPLNSTLNAFRCTHRPELL